MDPFEKILQGMPKQAAPTLTPEAQKALDTAKKSLDEIGQEAKKQAEIIQRSLKTEQEADRAIEFYEKLRNQAEDLGDTRSHH